MKISPLLLFLDNYQTAQGMAESLRAVSSKELTGTRRLCRQNVYAWKVIMARIVVFLMPFGMAIIKELMKSLEIC